MAGSKSTCFRSQFFDTNLSYCFSLGIIKELKGTPLFYNRLYPVVI